MMEKIKKIIGSKWIRWGFTVVIFYFVFTKVNVVKVVDELKNIPIWFLVVIIFYYLIGNIVWAYRWALLVLKEVTFRDVLFFVKSMYVAGFYGILIPSTVGSDIIKWIPLIKKYPHLSKTKLASSVVIDRIVGISAFSVMALIAAIIGKAKHYQFPDYILWLFILLVIGVVSFHVLVNILDFEKLFGKIPILRKLLDIIDIFKKGNKKRILWCLFISFLAEPIWILPIWFLSLILKSNMSLISIFVTIPIMNLILSLPISIGGFGAREVLFLYFFRQSGISDEKILAVSAGQGLIGILGMLVGGIFLLF